MNESPPSLQQPTHSVAAMDQTRLQTQELVSAPKAIVSSVAMTTLFVLGLALIQVLFSRATPDGDKVVRVLEYCAMAAGYSLLALPIWGIFDTLRRTHLYVSGPKYIIAFGYVGLMAALLYVAYKLVLSILNFFV